MRVFVTGIAGAASLNTVSVLDALDKSNTAWQALSGSPAPDLFDAVAVGVDPNPIQFTNGVQIQPGTIAGAEDAPDVVVVPGLDDNVRPSRDANLYWVPWLQQWAAAGSIIASSCTGAFLLAEAGLLDGRRATTHWVAEPLFRADYPQVELDIASIVIDEGDVITSGGATTAFNLVHYLVTRFGSAERAAAASRMMLLDSGRSSQLPFAMIGLHRDHGDRVVQDAQSAIQQNLIDPISVRSVAEFVGVSTRTLNRRFDRAIGIGPKAYLEEVRIGAAKRLLEQTDRTIADIRADVGFRDATAFRRAFKRHAGTTPTEYRRRFGSRVNAARS